MSVHASTRESEQVESASEISRSGGRDENNSTLHNVTCLPYGWGSCMLLRGRIILPMFGRELAELACGSPEKQHQAPPWHDEGQGRVETGRSSVSLSLLNSICERFPWPIRVDGEIVA